MPADSSQEIIVATETTAAPPAPAQVGMTPMDLLSRALDRGANIDMIEKFMDLQDRHERSQAKKAFDAAIAEAKAEIKPITKNREGHNGKKYADQAAYASAVDAILAQHGLTYRYRANQDEKIHVTCVLSHRDGYSEETTLSGAPDTSGNKSGMHALGSTLTYLQRYSLTLALGLAAAEDDDGHAASAGEPITAEQLKTLRTMIDDTNADILRLCETLKIDTLPDLPQSRFAEAEKLLTERAKLIAQKRKQSGGAK